MTQEIQIQPTVGQSNANPGLQVYYTPRRFSPDSKLHRYLASKCPDLVPITRTDFNLFEVLTALKRVISSDRLYDPQNPTVVLCDTRLEEALDVKALHVSEIREQVCKQFHLIFERASTEVPVVPVVPVVPATTPSVETQPIALPSWASTSAAAVIARTSAAPLFNIEGRYLVKPEFLKVLRMVEGVNQTQCVFPYREVANLLSKYIMNHKEKFFDLRNIRVALVEGDQLGIAFGVKAFARSQVTCLMRAQLIPFFGSQPPEDSDQTDGPPEVTVPVMDPQEQKEQEADTYRMEYEIDTDSEHSVAQTTSDEDSEIEEHTVTHVTTTDFDFVDADTEPDACDDSSDWDMFKEFDKMCLTCHIESTKGVKYCTKCWQDRKRFIIPPRKRRSSEGARMTITLKQRQTVEPTKTLEKESLCVVCCFRPKNSCFIHGQCSHQACCYPCAKKIFNDKHNCPICRRKIEKITKHFVH